MKFASMTLRTLILEGLVLAGVGCLSKEGAPISVVVPEPKSPIPPAAATAEVTATIVPPTPTRIAIATPTLRPLEAVPSPYAVVTRAIDDARDILDAKKNVIATLNGNRNLISFAEDSLLTETQLKTLMEKNNIGLAFKNGLKGNPDKLFKMEKGELKEIPIPQLTTRLTPDDFWFDQDNPENPHGLMTEKIGTKTHVIFDGKNWVEYVDGKSTGRVVFDMQKEPAAVGGAVPGAKETVVTVTPKPPLKETSQKPIFGDVKLDAALKAMQSRSTGWTGWLTIDGDQGRQGCEVIISRGEQLGSVTWKYPVSGVDGLPLKAPLVSWNENVPIYLVKINGNTTIATKTGKEIPLKDLGLLSGKRVLVIGPPLEYLRDYAANQALYGIGIVVDQ